MTRGIAARFEVARDLAAAVGWLLEVGRTVPCTVDPPAWWSEDPDDAAYAVKMCGRCPALAACRTYVGAHRERWGVWAGLTREARGERSSRRGRRPQRQAVET